MNFASRWAGRQRFVILEAGFGLGQNFLAALQAWRQDAARCDRLVYLCIEPAPPRAEQLRSPLAEAWPPLTPNLHRLSFEAGQVQLLLCVGDLHRWMRELVADDIDAFVLNGLQPDSHTLKALTRRAASDATGLEVRHRAQRPAAREPLAPEARHALIVGAGLAGAACAWALSQQGIACTVLDARPGPAQVSSGNPAGLYHGTLNPDDGTHARFNRAAALLTERTLRELPALSWRQQGLLRLELERDPAQMQALIERLGLPIDYVQALSVEAAQAASGLDLRRPAWFYPGGGALPPPDYVAALLNASGAQTCYDCSVAHVKRIGAQWQALDASGRVLAEAPLIILAGGHESLNLLRGLTPDLPLVRQRGQLSHLTTAAPRPRLPVAGLGYAIADQADGLWCGATSQDEDMDAALRAEDQARNMEHWGRLSHTAPVGGPLAGRVAWRLATPDRLPLVGGLPLPGYAGRMDQPRFIPRLPSLVLCTAFGSRGITWAALCAQVAAAQVTGAPCPLEASLVDAIDPARFMARQSNTA